MATLEVLLCKQRFESIKQRVEKQGPIAFDVGTWQISGLPPYTGQLEISVEKETVNIKASLIADDACSFGMECELEQKKTKDDKNPPLFVINNWVSYV